MSEASRIPTPVGARRKAREFALLGVYESLLNASADFAAIDANLVSVITDDGKPVAGCDLTPEDFAGCDKDFYREILEGVLNERQELEARVSGHLDREISRLSVVERACLLIGTWELIHRPENPYRVVINEAVELSKQFGANSGYKPVNGVLDKIAADVRPAEVQKKK